MKRMAFMLCLVLLSFYVRPLLAHGGGEIVVAGEVAGPYRMTVWAAPNVIEAGKTIHITVGLGTAADNAPVLDAGILVEVFSPESNDLLLSTPATTERSVNKLFYETDFILEQAGAYPVSVVVNDGEAEVTFNMEVNPATFTMNWLLVGIIGLGLVIAVTVFKMWYSQADAGDEVVKPRRGKA